MLDAATYDHQSQADFLSMTVENLEMIENKIYVLKALLKEPDFIVFEEVKAATAEQLRVTQK